MHNGGDMNRIVVVCLAGCLGAAAQTVPTTVRVTTDTVPAGGLAQMKVLLTSPKPIVSGDMAVDLSAVSFSSIDGISLFSNTGDVSGAAVVKGGQVNVQFTSPNATFGTVTDYPLLTIALTVSNTALPLQVFPVVLNPAASVWQGLLGTSGTFEFQQGSITVEKSTAVNITNVIPGGGSIPANGTFTIVGTNFSPQTKFAFRNLSVSGTTYVSPTQVVATVRSAGLLDGTLIQVQNPDKTTDSYYSYMRGVPLGQSTVPLLAVTTPVFSIQTATQAILPPTISPLVNPAYFTAIALQNPNVLPATIAVEAHNASGALTGVATVTLPFRARLTREVAELLGAPLPTGGYLRVLSSQPVQVMGLLGNTQTGVVLPVNVNVISGPALPPPPPPTPTGGGGGGGTGGGGTTGGHGGTGL